MTVKIPETMIPENHPQDCELEESEDVDQDEPGGGGSGEQGDEGSTERES